MIPANKPVLGLHLALVKSQLGCSTADICWLLGVSITKWTQIVNGKGRDRPVTDPTLALMVRLLDSHPELSLIPKAPSATEFFEFMNEIAPTDQKRFSILLGAEASAANRWLTKGQRQGATQQRLMHCLKLFLLSRPAAERPELLDSWSNVVATEGKARGGKDVFKEGRWNKEAANEANGGVEPPVATKNL